MSETKELTREQLLERRAKRERERQAARDALELASLRLEDELSSQGLKRGVDFEIVDEGLEFPIAVRRGPGVIFSKWKSEPASEQSTTEFIEASIVSPSKDEFHAYAMSFPPVRDRVELAIASLYKAKVRLDAGKF